MVCGFDEWSCREQVKRLRDYLSTKQAFVDDKFMDDLAFTLSQHRSRFMWKTAVIGTSIANLIDSFSGALKLRSSVRRPTVAFIFTGQGAQWPGMGKELLYAYPVFRESISKIDEFLKTLQAPFRVYGTQNST
jgi:acyl transferase domain-containing protein